MRTGVERHVPSCHATARRQVSFPVAMAIVATGSALALGRLISNANSWFGRLGGKVTALSAEILRDKILLRYGSDARAARQILRQCAKQTAVDMFPANPAHVRRRNPSTY